MRPIRFGEVYKGQDGVERQVVGRSVGVDSWLTFVDLDNGGRRKSMKVGDWRRLHAGLKDGGVVGEEEG